MDKEEKIRNYLEKHLDDNITELNEKSFRYKTPLRINVNLFGKNSVLLLSEEEILILLADLLSKQEKFDIACQMVDINRSNPYSYLIDDCITRLKYLQWKESN